MDLTEYVIFIKNTLEKLCSPEFGGNLITSQKTNKNMETLTPHLDKQEIF